MNVSSWLKRASKTIDHLDAELILAKGVEKERIFLHGHPEYILTQSEEEKANQDLVRRQKGEPLAYILGFKEFYGRKFKVTADVLIPRPETEAIIENIKSLVTSFPDYPSAPLAILDVGTGSGCIAITLALELTNTHLTAVDNSPKALDCTQYNIAALGASNISTKISDLFAATPEKYHIIVANLPYVDPDWAWLDRASLDYEPSSALYAPDGGLALIKRLIKESPDHLRPGGYLVIESDRSQQPAVQTFAAAHTSLESIAALDRHSLVSVWRLPQNAAPSAAVPSD